MILGAAEVFDLVGKLSRAFSSRDPAVVPARLRICAPGLGKSLVEGDGSTWISFEIGVGASSAGAWRSCDMMR